MTVTPLERLLIDSCLDVDVLADAQSDLPGALARAGVSGPAANLIASGHGYTISAAVRSMRPQPSAREVEEYAHERMTVDPIFAMRMRDEARPTLERAFQVKFPATRSVMVDDLSAEILRIRVVDGVALHGLPQDSADPYDVDVDVDVDIDVDIDVDVDVDVDVDIDIDIDSVIDNVVEVVTDVASTSQTRAQDERWSAYWSPRRAHWASLQESSAR